MTPLAKGARHSPDWPVAKAFARAVCDRMAADAPQKYVINMAKKQRVGRIYLDYLRNHRMATAVAPLAPLSPRARPEAPVLMPLSWAQVKAGLDPMRFTIRSVPDLLARSKARTEYCDQQRTPADAIRRLGA